SRHRRPRRVRPHRRLRPPQRPQLHRPADPQRQAPSEGLSPVSDERFEGIQQWINTGVTIVAPVTLISGVLFYFGYVSSRAEYEYFGIDVDTIGLGTRDYVMRSPQTLLVPLLCLAIVGAGFLLLNSHIRQRISFQLRPQASGVDGANPEDIPSEKAVHLS